MPALGSQLERAVALPWFLMSWIREAAPTLGCVQTHGRENKEWLTLETTLLFHACQLPRALAVLGRLSAGVTVHRCCAGSCKCGVLSAECVGYYWAGTRQRRSGAHRSQWESFFSELSTRKAENPLVPALNGSLAAGFPIALLRKWMRQCRNGQGEEFIGWEECMRKEIVFCRIFLNRWVNSLQKIFWEQL